MTITKRIIGLLLALCLLVSIAAVGIVPAAADTTYETYAQATVQGSNILHCFDWSYNNIRAALPEIAAAGYTAVQTSPVQPPKDYNASWTDADDQWWKLYQPLGLRIAEGDSWLGSIEELTMLCIEAEEYGVKVIVDIVANHLANNGARGGTYDNLNYDVDEELQNRDYYHEEPDEINDESRYNITHYHMGQPDLNTGNHEVQQKVIHLLHRCIDCGVDGFRFDAAKHIEVPEDPDGTESDFWANVIDAARSYTNDELFIYGEILGSPGPDCDMENYTQFMSITDSYTGDRVLAAAVGSDSDTLSENSYVNVHDADKSVLWVESHNTYMGDSGSAGIINTASVSNEDITRAWAIVGSRAESTSLFFARPSPVMGLAGTDDTWKSAAVAEVNKFKNHFEGTSEYLASSGSS
ncbi:MAG: alpha-amylase, partial [Ruminococcus sp.]|nr:alpha-amylase [Ruminococcus sp.]